MLYCDVVVMSFLLSYEAFVVFSLLHRPGPLFCFFSVFVSLSISMSLSLILFLFLSIFAILFVLFFCPLLPPFISSSSLFLESFSTSPHHPHLTNSLSLLFIFGFFFLSSFRHTFPPPVAVPSCCTPTE